MKGYIKLYRKTMCSPIWQDPHYLKLWMYCLMKASHKEHEHLIGNQVVKLKAGEFVTGRAAMTVDLNKGMNSSLKQSELSWWRRLNNLEKWEMLNIKKTNKYSVVTIAKWKEYQEVDQVVNISSTSNVQQLNTNKKGKNDKNVENENKKHIYADFVAMTPDEYQKLFQEFGESGAVKKIENLSLYKGSTGKKYKNDYLTILSWERKKVTSHNMSIFQQGEESKKRQQKKSEISDEQKRVLKNWEEELPF